MAKTKVTSDGEIVPADEMINSEYPVFFKTPFNHDRDAESARVALKCDDPSKTQQSHMADADINNILRKFMKTGELNVVGTPTYLDIEQEFDLQDNMVTAWQVEQEWNNLPKEARAILQTPAKFVEWYDRCLEEGNVDGLREIGLIPPEKPKEEAQKAAAPPGGTPAPPPPKEAPGASIT